MSPREDHHTLTVSQQIATAVKGIDWTEVPGDVLAYAKLLIADTIGVALGGVATDVAAAARGAVRDMGGMSDGTATVLGTTDLVSPRDAALLNGILMDAIGMDDTHVEGACHATAVILPAALAVAEATSASGRDLLRAYIAGVEVQTRVAAAARLGFIKNGFATTSVAGAFGAAVAAATLLDLDVDGLTRAQGFVGGLAAGSMQFLGSGAWTKNINKGWPAMSGVTAAYFARNGFLAPADIYEGRFGTFANYTPDDHPVDLARVTRGFGTEWEVLHVNSKRYPVCHFLDSTVKATVNLRDSRALDPSEVEAILCLVPEGAVSTICEPGPALRRPVSAYGASSSLYYNVALALHHGTVTIPAQETHLHDHAILGTADMISYGILEDSTFPDVFESEVVISMRDGSQHRARVSSGALSLDEFEAKFSEQTVPSLGDTRSREVWSVLQALDDDLDVRSMTRMLVGAEVAAAV